MSEFADEPTLNDADGARVTERERAFYVALLDYPIGSESSGPILSAAILGFTAREHVERRHPGQVDAYAEKVAPPHEPERAAWLFGYRWMP